MLLRTIRLLALPAVLLYANSAYALIDAEAQIGKRWYNLDTAPTVRVNSTEVAVAAHIDPIPLVPVSFGARVASGTLDTDQLKGYYGTSGGLATINSASVFEAGLDIMAWIPLFPFITPYARLDIPVYGKWSVKGTVPVTGAGNQSFERDASLNGVQISVGARYEFIDILPLLPTAGFSLEGTYAAETWKETTATLNGNDVTKDGTSHALDSYAFFAGAYVKF